MWRQEREDPEEQAPETALSSFELNTEEQQQVSKFLRILTETHKHAQLYNLVVYVNAR